MMKTIHLLKLATLSAILVAASIISCTDHVTPDPGPDCTLLNGQPRFFPCEFVITKVEFCKDLNILDVFGTVTPAQPDINLPVRYAWSNYNNSPDVKILTYKVKLHIKRIANPPAGGSADYILGKPVGRVSDIMSFGIAVFPPIHPQVLSFIHPSFLPLGQSTVVVSDAEYAVKIGTLPPMNTTVYSDPIGNVLYNIHNLSTSNLLIAPPHNYSFVVDLAEAHILINPTFAD